VTILNDPLNINIAQQDVSYLTISGHVTIPNDVNINIVQQDLSFVTVSGPVTITNDSMNINITQQDLSYITVSGSVTIPALTVSISDVTILNDPININITHQDLSYVTISGAVTIPALNLDTTPIPNVWESDEFAETTIVVSSELIVYTLHCMNFAPDYRFVKLYDKSGTILTSDRPKLTLPVVADIPFSMQFPNGLLFTNSLQVKATRCLKHTDTNLAEEGDVHLIVTYAS
jgi:hypothetical protein